MNECFFDEIEDSRQDWKVEHSLGEILTVVMCGVSAGEWTVHGICAFARIKERWLREEVGFPLPHGLPSYNTVRRVLGILDPRRFQDAFVRWVEREVGTVRGGYAGVDGKSVRGSGRGRSRPCTCWGRTATSRASSSGSASADGTRGTRSRSARGCWTP